MSRLKGLITFSGGGMLMVLGIGMWRSPEIDWEGFVEAWSMVIGDIARLIDDPFAMLGVIVLVIGLLVGVSGLRRAVRG